MIKQERFHKLFNSLSQHEKDKIVNKALKLSEQFRTNSMSDLMRESRYHANEAMQTFRLKRQRIHHATLFAALQHAINSKYEAFIKAA